jgi:hypothetical protein
MNKYTLNNPPVFLEWEDSERGVDCRGCVGCIHKDNFRRHESAYGGLGLCPRLKNLNGTGAAPGPAA